MAARSIRTIQKIAQSINASVDLNDALNKLVLSIKQTLVVDVCSIYLHDSANGHYVLMATQGLNPEAVGKIAIAYSEGLVGLVGRRSEPVNVEHAPKHPCFKLIPACGEERYHSFLGLPVIQGGELLAILVVQQISPRQFDDQDIAFLTTLAALIAGNIVFAKAKGEIDKLTSGTSPTSGLYAGIAGAPGLSIGTGVVVYTLADILTVPDRVPDDPADEEKLFHAAIDSVVAELHSISEQLAGTLPEADRLLFDAYALIAKDEELISATIKRIRAGNWAQGALRDTIQWYAAQFEKMDNIYLSERADDIRDIGRRILGYLQRDVQAKRDYPEQVILVGENLSPLDIAQVPPAALAGLVSGHGSGYSHLAIVAHALRIPAVMGFSSKLPLSRLDTRTLVIDGYKGAIHISPNAAERQEYLELINSEHALNDELSSLRNEPAITTDAQHIHLYTNSGLVSGFSHRHNVGTEGIGLYRTELPFMSQESFPGEEEQYRLYRQVLEEYAPLPVTLRTLDVGGDKPLPYFPVSEPNPFLGWRGIRISLDHPEIFLTQVRAMLRANEGLNNLKILFPMITTVAEIDRAIALVHHARDQLLDEGLSIPFPEIGAMIEVPSTIYQIPAIARRVDFLSLGSNDLTQYLLAIDRNNERIAKLFDPLHPSVLEAFAQTARMARQCNLPLCICGEAAGDPTVAILLIAMQVNSLSLSAGDLPRIKWVIRSFSHRQAKSLWRKVRKLENPPEIRELLSKALIKHGLGRLIGTAGSTD